RVRNSHSNRNSDGNGDLVTVLDNGQRRWERESAFGALVIGASRHYYRGPLRGHQHMRRYRLPELRQPERGSGTAQRRVLPDGSSQAIDQIPISIIGPGTTVIHAGNPPFIP